VRKSPQPPDKSTLPDELLAAIGSVAIPKISATSSDYSLTYKQQLRKDALLWAEFMYSEYKRVKEQREDAQLKPTYHDNADA
jgi:hypothetical protein